MSVKDETQIEETVGITALFDGQDLTEETKDKITTIFEAVVSEKVKSIQEETVARLEEEYATKLEEQVELIRENLASDVDTYTTFVAEQWMEQNKLAVEQGIRTEIAESFISGLKGLFEQHNIQLPEEKTDVMVELATKIAELEDSLEEQITTNAILSKNSKELKKQLKINDLKEGMVATDAERLASLLEDVDFEDEDSFIKKATTIKEGLFIVSSETNGSIDSEVDDSLIKEENAGSDKPSKIESTAYDGDMAALIAGFSRVIGNSKQTKA
ncbi:MAG: hypothetical protein BV459_00315 [Thermoplasmata archaeon M11B2D]|nr:MAG: hypothetical protein BV459_00315 [Thermoplasmata archaeon M11B2D]